MGFAIDGCCVAFNHILTSILSVSVEPLKILCAEDAVALAPRAGDLNLEDFLIPFKFSNQGFFGIQGWPCRPLGRIYM